MVDVCCPCLTLMAVAQSWSARFSACSQQNDLCPPSTRPPRAIFSSQPSFYELVWVIFIPQRLVLILAFWKRACSGFLCGYCSGYTSLETGFRLSGDLASG